MKNLHEVSEKSFPASLADRGCRLVVYVEFVPVTDESAHLAPQSGNYLLEDHAGGCVLYEKRDQVEALLAQAK